MSNSESNLTNSQVKKPYAKPEIVYKEPLEAMAAACTPNGKTPTTPPGICTGSIFS